jgi:hypothetical protein
LSCVESTAVNVPIAIKSTVRNVSTTSIALLPITSTAVFDTLTDTKLLIISVLSLTRLDLHTGAIVDHHVGKEDKGDGNAGKADCQHSSEWFFIDEGVGGKSIHLLLISDFNYRINIDSSSQIFYHK